MPGRSGIDLARELVARLASCHPDVGLHEETLPVDDGRRSRSCRSRSRRGIRGSGLGTFSKV
jgi:hypothetical protein